MNIKAHWFIFAFVLFLCAQYFVSDAHAAVSWSNDPDFVVGVAGAPGGAFYTGYGGSDADIERQIHLAAEMGARIYRMPSESNNDVVEKVITLCEKYGIEVLLVIHSDKHTEESTVVKVKRFKGRVKYYQVDNEMSGIALRSYSLTGTDISHFGMSTQIPRPGDAMCLDIRVNKAINNIKIIRAEDPNAKILINGLGVHYAFLDYAFARFAQEGVDIDLLGWDWYSHRENNRGVHPSAIDGFNSIAKYIYDNYGKDIIICEYNMTIRDFDRTNPELDPQIVPFLPGNGNGKIDFPEEEDNMDILMGPYLVKNIQYLYNNRKENHIIGIMVYELIEQREHSDPFEAKHGITYSKRSKILGPKKAYYDVQKLLGGSFVPIQRLNPSAVLPDYTITASVIDVSTDGTVMSSQAGGTVTGSGVYRENDIVTLTAAAKPGHEFLGWYRGGIRISKNTVYKFTAYEDADNSERDSTAGKFI